MYMMFLELMANWLLAELLEILVTKHLKHTGLSRRLTYIIYHLNMYNLLCCHVMVSPMYFLLNKLMLALTPQYFLENTDTH